MKKLTVLAALAAASTFASGDIILGNLPPTNDGTQTAGINNLRQKGVRFTAPAAGTAAGNLTLRLGNYNFAGEAIAEIRDDAGSATTPGANVLLSFVAPAPGGVDVADYVFTPAGQFTLSPGTTYWIVVRGVAGQSFDWKASSPSVTPTGLATYNSTSFSSNGATWSASSIITSFQFETPAPGTMALAAGILGVAARRRR